MSFWLYPEFLESNKANLLAGKALGREHTNKYGGGRWLQTCGNSLNQTATSRTVTIRSIKQGLRLT